MDTRFTYDNFVSDNSFTLLEPIFEAIVLFSVIMLMIVIIKKCRFGFLCSSQALLSLFLVNYYSLVA
ncbi:hypothetical protein ABIA69_000158 [Lysinibacillus parviboronicapiens]|uniref:Uncharacterized protein n=1 Tax=Lysinibacillus parviboronicapiens TaxID=436516 RepID=A0ABV2PDJ9_9BACI